MLVQDLQNLQKQFLAIKTEAENFLGRFTDDQFMWRPGHNRWSIAQCVDHLIVTGRNSLSHIDQAIDEARSKALFAEGPFRYGLIETWFVRQMEAGARMRFKAPRAYLPSSEPVPGDIKSSFYQLQDEFSRIIEKANGIDLSRVKVNNSVSRWFKLSLGQELAFNAAHERRHLGQARRVTELEGFPCLPGGV